MATPLFATPRTPSRLSVGAEVSAIADQLGMPFMPWQLDLAMVANEIRPDGKGFAYPTVVAFIPRRAGKTVLALCHMIHRAQNLPRGFCWFTSQTASDARDAFRDEWLPLLEAAEGFNYTSRQSNGSENITFPETHGRIGIFAPTRKGLHGKDSDLVVVDEAWAFSIEDGKEIQAGARPTMATRPWRQQWIISAGADQHSGWLLDLRKRCRAQGAATDTGICYLEFHPEIDEFGEVAVDLNDPAVWEAVHPAVGHTIDIEFLEAERAVNDDAEFFRSYLNVPAASPELVATDLIDQAAWTLCGDEHVDTSADTGWHLSYDVNPLRTFGSVVMSRRADDGRLVTVLVAQEQGTAWIAPTIYDLKLKHDCRIVADDTGPSTTVTRELKDLGVSVSQLSFKEVQSAVGELLDDVANKRIVHGRQDALDQAVANVIPRYVGRGESVLMGRRDKAIDIGPALAMVLSTFSVRHTVTSDPVIVFGY